MLVMRYLVINGLNETVKIQLFIEALRVHSVQAKNPETLILEKETIKIWTFHQGNISNVYFQGIDLLKPSV